MEAILEVFREAAHEIAAEPVTFAIELVQFGILVFIIKLVAFGSKKKSGMLVNMINERHNRVVVSLQEAEAGEAALVDAQTQIVSIAAKAEAEARAMLKEARKQAREQAEAIDLDTATRVESIKQAAHEALEREQIEMLQGIREQLVEVVTQSTQQVLEQGLTPAEQRAVVQKAIVTGIDGLEAVTLS